MFKDEIESSKASPNLIVRALYRNIELIEQAGSNPIYDLDIPNYSMMSIFMVVACVEVFLNVYFRQLVESPKYSEIKKTILEQMDDRRFGLEQKIKKWPQMFFNKNIFGSKAGQRFDEYRKKRNTILHYKHTWEELKMGGFKVTVTDSTLIDDLDIMYMFNARDVVRNLFAEILKSSGCEEEQLKRDLQQWTGEIDLNNSL